MLYFGGFEKQFELKANKLYDALDQGFPTIAPWIVSAHQGVVNFDQRLGFSIFCAKKLKNAKK